MARPPGRPLSGYQDVGAEVRHSRRAVVRSWLILALLVAGWFVWTLIVYFIEPGLR